MQVGIVVSSWGRVWDCVDTTVVYVICDVITVVGAVVIDENWKLNADVLTTLLVWYCRLPYYIIEFYFKVYIRFCFLLPDEIGP